jgi:hypothetical protein
MYLQHKQHTVNSSEKVTERATVQQDALPPEAPKHSICVSSAPAMAIGNSQQAVQQPGNHQALEG